MKDGLTTRNEYGEINPLSNAFFQKAWEFCAGRFKRKYSEPKALRNGKLLALRALNKNSGDSITWEDFKRGYTILATWYSRGRIEHTIWERSMKP